MPSTTEIAIAPDSSKNVLIAKLKHSSGSTAQPTISRAALTPSVAIKTLPLAQHTFQEPRKRIVSTASLKQFEDSDTFAEILSFIQECNTSVVGKALTDDVALSDAARSILTILEQIQQLRRETPVDAADTTSRFGNPAFRTFYAKIRDNNDRLHRLIPELDADSPEAEGARRELAVYLQESWGNEKRIDYGSGMELNMACWLLCLCKLQILTLPQDGPAIVLRIFWKYIQVMRDIQSTYWLEPAGSHGVWGLDDYHFLPFLWGAAQLSNHRHLRPKSIHDPEILEEFSPKFMYFACIFFINSVKTASLRWHSPMLDDISGVKTWAKVNEGMIKMYRAEVLLKLPIAQHIFFGSMLEYSAGVAEDVDAEEDSHGHIHPKGHGHAAGEGQAAGWGDCCGIPIPSAFAAAEEEKRSNVRRIPFD